ncbi:MAG TPA: hypothetical protein VIW73_06920 [Candidatus Cybelea sp.]
MLNERAFAAITLGTLLAGLAACAGPATTSASAPAPLAPMPAVSPGYNFMTVDNQTDPKFNEILGINDGAKLTGFYGSGSASDPSTGYIVVAPYGQNNFRKESYPGAVDTELAGLNDKRTFVGFFRDSQNNVLGAVFVGGIWTNYKHPNGMPKGKSVTELLDVDSADIAVGFYTNSSGVKEPFTLDIMTNKYQALSPPGGDNAVATSITGHGDIVGYLQKSGHAVGFLLRRGTYTELAYPGATDTKFLGVTVYDQIVGSYSNSSGATHGFLLTNPLKESIAWQRIDEPNAVGTTVITGINQSGDIVGYYVDSAGNTNGFFASRK